MQTYLDAYPKHITLGNTMRNTSNIFFNLKFGIIFQNKINDWKDWKDILLPIHAKIECFYSIFFLRILIFKVDRIHELIYRTRSINEVCLKPSFNAKWKQQKQMINNYLDSLWTEASQDIPDSFFLIVKIYIPAVF